ncbi:MAG: SPOR domain-containing protein [Acidobacteriaceae bacterium]
MRTTAEREEQQTETEITLGMTSLLGIFFGLVLICGIFFGLGYSLGRGSSSHPSAAATTASSAVTANDNDNHASKPSAGQSSYSAQNPAASEDSAPASDNSSVTVPENSGSDSASSDSAQRTPSSAATESPAPTSRPAPMPVSDGYPTSRPAAAHPLPPVAPEATAKPAVATTYTAASGSGIMVQIAAVSHQEDADVLVSALKRRGYTASAHSEPQDKLLHVQVGPFVSHDEAKAMRAKLLTDGYNAIIK